MLGSGMSRAIEKTPPEEMELDWRELFSATLDAAVDGVVVIDERSRVLRVNSAIERLFGWSEAELVGERVEILMPEPFASDHARYVDRYLAGGEARIIGFGREVVAKRRDGSLFPIDLAVGEGKTNGRRIFVGLIRDLTSRREMETELRRQSEAVERMFDNGQIATAMTDSEGRLLQVNAAWERVLDRPATELVGELVSRVTHPDQREPLAEALAGLSPGRAEITLDRYVCVRPDGETRHGALYLAAVFEQDAKEPLVVVQMVDRSQELQAEAELRVARDRLAHVNRIGTLGEMAAGIAHEVNQPLGAIANYAEAARLVLQQGPEAHQRLDEVLEKIAAQARRAGDVIRRLRSLARGDGGGRRVVEINSEVRSAVRLAELDGQTAEAGVVLDLAPELPELLADPIQIQQVLLNLLRNGFEAVRDAHPQRSRRLPPLLVRTRGLERDIEVSVRDRGTGVDPDVAKEIMSPFVTTKGSGMGMGLAICQSIVSSHGGRIWFEPNPDGLGTEFKFTLPVERPVGERTKDNEEVAP